MRLPELAGKTALVTGASRGIGAAAALALAKAGCARILLHYHSGRYGVEETASAVALAGSQSETMAADLSTDAGIASLAGEIKGRQVDILINNAGSLVQRAKLGESTPALFDTVMTLNAKSAWFLAQAVVPGMVERGHGVIVNLSSIAARNGGGPGATIYAAAKAAVACMTKGMARELAASGIRVNAISPGTVDNDFHARFSTREMLDSVVRATPQGRLSTNEEMADVIVFLCSHAARNIHGQTIEINGGMYMV
jgi:3-oxoacyl-[acyl-carrier protein] reductase